MLAGLGYGVVTPLFKPDQVGLASDVYYYAARTALAGENIYEVSPPNASGYRFLYPPIVVLLFVPHALLGSTTGAYALQTLLNVGASLATAAVLRRALARRGVALERLDGALLVGIVLCSSYGMPQVLMGQTTLWLGLAFVVGLDALDRDAQRLAGAAFAAAALVKLFPAAIGAWLLRLRARRAVAVATATGLGGLLAGVVVFGPDLTAHYLEHVLVARFDGETFGGSTDPTSNLATVRRQLVAAFGLGPRLLTPIALAVLAPIVLACYRRIDTDCRRQSAVLATIVGALLFLPLHPLYFPLLTYPVVVLAYRLPIGRARLLFTAGVLLTYALLDLGTVVLTAAVLPTTLETAAVDLARRGFAVVLPPTLGMWLLLAASLLVQSDAPAGDTPSAQS